MWFRIFGVSVVVAATLTSCGLDTDQLINDMNNNLEDDSEIYFDEDCADSDGDGFCD